ncbi:hypothetical protein SY83_11935 [Paenibacillus swuensis]|uniref:Uncharacterized protein n=1 Tax=Paenibacillus swuensis TaxID=1178515 RepID=A0A172TIK2_9BACL|nr:hypothetical protein [Paenibacillus swuensis]ANE46868.1 hypothetical protein SY83_11935 [Paenibacillus swuensis]
MLTKLPRSRLAAYAASKLGAAGVVFLGFLMIMSRFQLYEMWELTRQLRLWLFIYVYAILFSVAVDVLLRKRKAGSSRTARIIMLYTLGGYIPFLIWFREEWIWGLYAGFFGVCCSLTFLCATRLFRGRWPYSAITAILLLAGAVYVSVTDFTVTKEWTDRRTTDGYEAEFVYFHGHRTIPVKLEAGQTLSYRIDWQIKHGGYGTHLDAEGGAYTNVKRDGEGWIAYSVNAPTTVNIVVTGKRAQGALDVRWNITE